MDDELKSKIIEYIDSQLDDALESEDSLYNDAKAAIDSDKLSDAIMYLRGILLINPDNQQAKQKLLEIYPKAIQEIIDDGRYEDAFKLYNNVSNTILYLKLDIKLSNVFYLRIKDTIVEINKIWDFSKAKTGVYIEAIKEGIGNLMFTEVSQLVGAQRGEQADSSEEAGGTTKQATLEIDDIYVNIYTKKGMIIVQSDYEVKVELTDDEGNEIEKQIISGDYQFKIEH